MYPSRPHSLIEFIGNNMCSSTNLSPGWGLCVTTLQGDFVLSLPIIVLTCMSSKTLHHIPHATGRQQPEGYRRLENERGDVAQTLEVSPVSRRHVLVQRLEGGVGAKMAPGEKSRTQPSVRTFNSSSFLPTQTNLIHHGQNALGFGIHN